MVDMNKPGVVVIGPNVWGKGQTIQEALKNAYSPKKYVVYAVPFALLKCWVGEVDGSLCWEGDVAPFKIMSKGIKEKKNG